MNKAKEVGKQRLTAKHNGSKVADHQLKTGASAAGGENGHNRITADTGAARDGRREFESAIQRYADPYEFAPVGYITFDRSGRIEQVNLAACELLNVKREYLVGSPVALHVVPKELDIFLNHLVRCRSGQRRVESTLQFKKRNAGSVPVLISSTPTGGPSENSSYIFQTAIVDLTERERAEQVLRDKEAELELIVTQTPFMLTRCTRDLHFRYASRAYAEMVGRAPEEISGRPIVEFLGQDGLKAIRPYINRVLAGETVEYEAMVPFCNGRSRFLHSVYVPDKDSFGKVVGWVASIIDITERKETESARMRLAAVVRSSADAIVAKDLNGVITDWNESAERIFGYTAKEIIGKSILTIIPQDRHIEEKEILSKIRRGQSIDHYQTLRRRKDGRLIDVSLTISPIKDQAGKIIGVSKIARDISREKQIERRLAEQARMLDFTEDAIIARDSEDRILYWNKGAEKTYGFNAKQALGQITHNLLKTRHPQPIQEIVQQAERDGYWRGEFVHYHKNGRRIVALSQWAVDYDETGRRRTVLETNTDITHLKQTEEALSQSEGRLRAIIEQAAAGMVHTDLRGKVTFVNQKFCQMLGYAADELVGQKIPDITYPDDRPKTRKMFSELVKHSKPYDVEKRYLRKDKTLLWVNVSASPVLDENGLARSAIAVVVDITARKAAEDALKRSKGFLEEVIQQRTKALRESNEELQHEIARRRGLEGQILEISDREQQRLAQELHDGLCQELTAIGFMARATSMRLRNHRVLLPEDVDQIATLVTHAAADARNISRALHRVDLDAAGFVDAIESLAKREIWKTPCRFEMKKGFQIHDDKAAVNLYGIAREAVLNANKHAKARQIVIQIAKSKGEITLAISDDGVGLKQPAKESPGMGFHIMDYRARSLGGRLEVESQAGKGTRITCYLPIKQ